jgi:hypothetical protein
MSALRSIDVTQPPGSGATVQVPKSYMPEMDRALLDANPRHLDFPASAGSFVPSGLSQILVPPTANRYILGGSAYLNFDFTLTATTTGTFTTMSQQSYFTGGPTKSAAALIDRITVSAAGTTLCDVSNYPIWHNIILLHAASQDYVTSTSILENAFTGIDRYTAAVTNQTKTIPISLPLALQLFNTTKAFPLWAFAGPLVINIYWSSFARSIGCCPQLQGANQFTDAATATDTTFSGSWAGANLSLRAVCTDVDPEYVMEQRKQMAAGKLLVFQYDQAMGMQTQLGSTSINFGVNVSSLLAVLGAQLTAADATAVATAPAEALGAATAGNTLQNFAGSWGYSANESDSIRVFRDGTQLTSFPLMASARDDAFPVLTQALGVLFSTSNASICRKVDGSSTFVASSAANNNKEPSRVLSGARRFNIAPAWGIGLYRGGSVFSPAGFVWGIPAKKCSDDSISNQGVFCQQLQLIVDRGLAQAGTHYLFYVFSSALAIDASGNCVVKR